MIVLDTNVISELMHPRADPGVLAWVDAQPVDEVYLTAVTTAELRYGVARLPDGRRKTDLADRVRRTVEEDFTGRVLPFDDEAAVHYADIVVGRERRGMVISMADAQIAAVCRSHSAARNTKDFAQHPDHQHPDHRFAMPWDPASRVRAPQIITPARSLRDPSGPHSRSVGSPLAIRRVPRGPRIGIDVIDPWHAAAAE